MVMPTKSRTFFKIAQTAHQTPRKKRTKFIRLMKKHVKRDSMRGNGNDPQYETKKKKTNRQEKECRKRNRKRTTKKLCRTTSNEILLCTFFLCWVASWASVCLYVWQVNFMTKVTCLICCCCYAIQANGVFVVFFFTLFCSYFLLWTIAKFIFAPQLSPFSPISHRALFVSLFQRNGFYCFYVFD